MSIWHNAAVTFFLAASIVLYCRGRRNLATGLMLVGVLLALWVARTQGWNPWGWLW
jgi:hypothetical protein